MSIGAVVLVMGLLQVRGIGSGPALAVCRQPVRLWWLSPGALSSSPLGGHAGQFLGPDRLVTTRWRQHTVPD